MVCIYNFLSACGAKTKSISFSNLETKLKEKLIATICLQHGSLKLPALIIAFCEVYKSTEIK
jgi:hypothetical protein